MGKRSVWTREDIVVWEWLAYYLAQSPFYSDKLLFPSGGRTVSFRRKNTYFSDIGLKKNAFLKILIENLEIKAKIMGVDARRLDRLHLSYLQKFVKSFSLAREESDKLGLRMSALMREKEEELKKKSKDLSFEDDEIEEEIKSNRARNGYFVNMAHSRRGECERTIEFTEKKLLKG